jgi:hypothetical protein
VILSKEKHTSLLFYDANDAEKGFVTQQVAPLFQNLFASEIPVEDEVKLVTNRKETFLCVTDEKFN